MEVLHYGLQRSGTNFLETLLKTNYKIDFLNSNQDRSSPLQKHCRFYENKEVIPEPQYTNKIFVQTFEQFESLFERSADYYIIISKDPYSWYLSYRNWAKICSWPKVNHHYIEEYNLFHKKFIDLSSRSDQFIFVRYVDLLSNISVVLDELEKKMGIKKRLLSRVRLMTPASVPQSVLFSESKRAYYLNEEYLNNYSAEEINTLNDLLDHQVSSFLGYELCDSIN